MFLSWDYSSDNVRGVPNAMIAEIPLFVFPFEGEVAPPLVLTAQSTIVASSDVSLDRAGVLQFAAATHPDLWSDELELLATVNLTNLLDPMDPLLQIQLKASKACIVHQNSGEIIAFLLWFHFGSAVGFIIGPVGKLATIFGSNVDGAYQNAKKNLYRGVFEIVEREYSPPSRLAPSTLAEWDWFGP